MSDHSNTQPDRRPMSRNQLASIARGRRARPSLAERLLWDQLNGGQLLGLSWRRQHVLEPHIADFYCAHIRLAVEVRRNKWSGQAMDRTLEVRHGVSTVRLSEQEVVEDMKSATEFLTRICRRRLAWRDGT